MTHAAPRPAPASLRSAAAAERCPPPPPCPAARWGPRGAERSGRAAPRSCEYRARAERRGPARRSPPPGGGRRGAGSAALPQPPPPPPCSRAARQGPAEQGATRQHCRLYVPSSSDDGTRWKKPSEITSNF